ncbi:hypothetical protein F2P56_010859 [Juglans regia]|uniref:Taxadiene 5-alpha hydroxylase-like n=1 Tax=Juglans regia TaxID=51240 RepID=A0A833XR35_JUGRE|nr:hypothetical protein F2P56_010859 [Juglans regia]
MSFLFLVAFTLISAFLLSKYLSRPRTRSTLPGGSLGYPLIGETLSFLRAQREDRGPEWLEERISKHGSVFKTSILGSRTVVIIGQAGNKFVLGADDGVLAAKQPLTLQTIGGKQNILELTGYRYRLVKGAMMTFLKPESLQKYIKEMDELVKTLFLTETKGRDTIQAVVFMKELTFSIASNILFGIKDDYTREALFDDFSLAFKAIMSLPVNFPGTVHWRGRRARSRIVNKILPIMEKRKEELLKGIRSPSSDVLSCMLELRDENKQPIADDMIIDNFVTLMIASHDTSAILLSLMIWKLARDPEVYKKVLEEQLDIVKKREGKEQKHLTWAETREMKYTWRVAQELMRMIPPVFGSFRKALKDTSYGGYDIPKGWQVTLGEHI